MSVDFCHIIVIHPRLDLNLKESAVARGDQWLAHCEGVLRNYYQAIAWCHRLKGLNSSRIPYRVEDEADDDDDVDDVDVDDDDDDDVISYVLCHIPHKMELSQREVPQGMSRHMLPPPPSSLPAI